MVTTALHSRKNSLTLCEPRTPHASTCVFMRPALRPKPLGSRLLRWGQKSFPDYEPSSQTINRLDVDAFEVLTNQRAIEIGIQPLGGQQFFVTPSLNNAAGLENENLVGPGDR